MPAYPGVALATVPVNSNISPLALYKGDSQYLVGKLAAGATQLPVSEFNVATENFAGASIAVNMESQDADTAPGVGIEILYAAAAGAGESVAVQEADTDADAFYVTPVAAAFTIATAAALVARADLIPIGGKFVRVNRTRGANNVACTIKITRQS